MDSSAIKRLRMNRWNVEDKILFAAVLKFSMTVPFHSVPFEKAFV